MLSKWKVATVAMAGASFAVGAQDFVASPPADQAAAEQAPDPGQAGNSDADVSQSAADAAAAPTTTAETAAGVGTIPVEAPTDAAASDAAGPKPTRNRFIEEVIVTAQKREENIQTVPISIAAFSAEKLEASGVHSTNDLPLVTPGLTISGSAGYSLIYLRGIGTSAFIPSFDPSVATYVDGIYIPSQQATLTDLGGVERVEVLKGPQGTLFGRNATGGAINVITKSPGSSPELSVNVEGGSYPSRDAMTGKMKVYASYPLTDTVSASISGIYSHDDPYYKVVADPKSITQPPNYSLLPDVSKGGRVKLRWQPTDDLDFVLTGFRILQSGSRAFLEPNVDPSPAGAALGVHAPGDYETNANTPPVSHSKTTTLYGTARWKLPWMDIKLLAGDQKQDSYNLTYDFDGGQPNVVSFTAQHSPSHLQTAELQFVSNDQGWTPDWLKWIGGLFYLQQEAGYDPFIAYVGDVGLLPPNITGLLYPPTGPVGLGAHGVLQTHSYSGFVQSTADLTDWFAITLGGRYQREDRFLIKQYVQEFLPGTEPQTLFQFNQPRRYQSNFSPKVSLNFKPFDNTLLYVSFARAYKSGSYNIVTLYTPPGYVEPETVTTYEIGAKTTIVQGLTFNTAIFDNKIKNLQESKLSLLSGGAISAENAGAARSRGAEFDAVWAPFLESDPGFVVTGGATYLDAIYTDYKQASGFNDAGVSFGPTGPLPAQDFSGHRIARTPRVSGTFGLSQTIDTHYGPVEAAADGYYNRGFNFSSQNAPSTEQQAYVLVNARLSFLYEPWKTRITAFGRNLTNRKYADTSLVVDFGTYKQLAPPRFFGLSLSYDY